MPSDTAIPMVERILGRIDALSPAPKLRDAVKLTSEERASAHLVTYSEAGRTLRISLPRGAELNDGDVLAVDGETAIVVVAAEEDLFVVPLADSYLASVVGYQLGNLHRPVRFTPEAMLTPADPMVADHLGRLGIAFERRRAPFVGRRYGAYGTHGHAHGDHGHDHDHAHGEAQHRHRHDEPRGAK